MPISSASQLLLFTSPFQVSAIFPSLFGAPATLKALFVPKQLYLSKLGVIILLPLSVASEVFLLLAFSTLLTFSAPLIAFFLLHAT